MLVTKVEPVGIDKELAKVQKVVYDYLQTLGWTNYESYGRVNVNDGKAEFSISGKDYKDVVFDDRFFATSFIVVQDSRAFDVDVSDRLTVDCSMIFQMKLNKLYSAIPHRADEEANQDCFRSFGKYIKLIEGLTTGQESVFSGLNIQTKKELDMSNSHVVKIDFKISHCFHCKC